jgi:type IV pilus assembly protein PilF
MQRYYTKFMHNSIMSLKTPFLHFQPARALAIGSLVCASLVGCQTTEEIVSPSRGQGSTASAGSGSGRSASSGSSIALPPSRSGDSRGATSPNSVIPQSSEESEDRRRARTRLELAAGYYQQGNYSVALEELRLALQIDPNYASAFGLLGLLYMDLGDRPKSDESFRRALEISPRDADLNNNYGWYLCQTNRAKESIAYFNLALEDRLYPTPAKPLHNAGICSLRSNNLPAAEAYFRRAFQVEPGNPVTNYQLSLFNLKKGELEQAKFYSKRLLDNFDANSQTLMLAVCVSRKAGDRNAEASYAQQLRRKFSASPEATRLQNNDCELSH